MGVRRVGPPSQMEAGASTVDNPLKVVCFGLDSAGKTTILYRLKFGETVQTTPTNGFNVETVVSRAGTHLTFWDTGGGNRMRELWRHYAINSHGIFFVVDSNDRERMQLAGEELSRYILHEDDFRGIPLIILANKQDLPNAASSDEISEALHLYEINDRKCHIKFTSGATGVGLYEALALMSIWASEYTDSQQVLESNGNYLLIP